MASPIYQSPCGSAGLRCGRQRWLSALMSVLGHFRTWRIVLPESVVRSKADISQALPMSLVLWPRRPAVLWSGSCIAKVRHTRSTDGSLFCTSMADPARFELTTSAFGGQRSIQLSYGSATGRTIPERPVPRNASAFRHTACRVRPSRRGAGQASKSKASWVHPPTTGSMAGREGKLDAEPELL